MFMQTNCVIIFVVFLEYVMGNVSLKYNVPLSSATTRQGTMLKPTKKIKRPNLEVEVEELTKKGNLSIISARRLTYTDIWSWEYWCLLQPKIGNCSKHELRYFYDIQLDQCMNFTYSGCDGNNNNFDSLVNCERYCNGATYLSLKEDVPSFCGFQPDAGICLALSTRLYYDINKNDCLEFQYGGCGGNRNRFDDKQSCLRDCKGS